MQQMEKKRIIYSTKADRKTILKKRTKHSDNSKVIQNEKNNNTEFMPLLYCINVSTSNSYTKLEITTFLLLSLLLLYIFFLKRNINLQTAKSNKD